MLLFNDYYFVINFCFMLRIIKSYLFTKFSIYDIIQHRCRVCFFEYVIVATAFIRQLNNFSQINSLKKIFKRGTFFGEQEKE